MSYKSDGQIKPQTNWMKRRDYYNYMHIRSSKVRPFVKGHGLWCPIRGRHCAHYERADYCVFCQNELHIRHLPGLRIQQKRLFSASGYGHFPSENPIMFVSEHRRSPDQGQTQFSRSRSVFLTVDVQTSWPIATKLGIRLEDHLRCNLFKVRFTSQGHKGFY